MSYLDERRKHIEDGRPLPPKKKYTIPKKSDKRIQKEKQQGIEIVKQKPRPKGWFQLEDEVEDMLVKEEELNSKIVAISPTPESYDGKKTDYITHDEIGLWDTKGVDESLVNLSADLDYVLSQYIRHKYADKKGMVKCFTCPIVLPIKDIQNGHYIKRSNRATRFLEANLRPQCPTCNQDHNYDETPYTNALEREQIGITEQLKELAKETYKATRSELKQLLIEYRSKLDLLKKNK